MSPTTSVPVFPFSAIIAVTFLDSDPACCTTLAASLSFISCSGLSCDCAELITFSNSGSAFDPSRYDTTQDQCMPSKPRSANPTGQPQMFVKPEPRMPPTARLLTRQARITNKKSACAAHPPWKLANITSDAAVVRCNSHGLLLVAEACNHPNLLVIPFRAE